MYNVHVVAPVVVFISWGSGIAAGVVAMRHFRLDVTPTMRRILVFWPTFLVVTSITFIVCSIAVGLFFGSN